MRAALLLTLAACATPPAPTVGAASPLRLPPDQPMQLELSPLVVGELATLRVLSGPPSARVDLYAADRLRSTCTPTPAGACALMSGRIRRVGSVNTNAAGVAQVQWRLNTNADHLVIQGFAGARASDAAFGWVHPAGTRLDGVDRDGDGLAWTLGDCGATHPDVRAGAYDPPDDGLDLNCDGVDSMDEDHDGAESVAVGGLDCDDTSDLVSPLLADPYGDGLDVNCDGVDGVDRDGDGSPAPLDCDDTTPLVSPLLADPYGDGLDANCDGVDGMDRDEDGFPAGVDCDDLDPVTNPPAADPLGDGADTNCDGVDGVDADQDGFAGGVDCADLDPQVNPNAADPLGDGADTNCDLVDGVDADGDGYPAGPDCADLDPERNQHRHDPLGDGVDNDCDGADGHAVPARPDLDGDGMADLVIGVPGAVVNGVRGGAVWVVPGAPSGPDLARAWMLSRGDGSIAGNPVSGAELGTDIAVGDYDGDLVDDLALARSPNGTGADLTIAFSAQGGGPTSQMIEIGGASLTLWAESGRMGFDRADELLLASPASTFGTCNQILLGRVNGTLWDPRFWTAGPGAYKCEAGAVVDANGNGYDEHVCTNQATPGALFRAANVYQGGIYANLDLGGPTTTTDTAITGGDLDGDGYEDIVVGLPSDNSRGPEAGLVAVLWGGALPLPVSHLDISSFLATASPLPLQRLGEDLVTCDLDGDGRKDIVTAELLWTGRILVLPGAADRDLDGGYALTPAGAGFGMERALSCADLNQDGVEDLIVGSPREPVGGIAEMGEVWIWYGAPGGVDATPNLVIDPGSLGMPLTPITRFGGGLPRRVRHPHSEW